MKRPQKGDATQTKRREKRHHNNTTTPNTRRHETQTKNGLLNVKATYFLNTSTYIRTNVRTMSRSYESYDKAFEEKGIFKTGGDSQLKDWLKWANRDEVAKVDTNWSNHFGTPGEDSSLDIYQYVEPSSYNLNGFRFQRDGARRGGYSKGEDGYLGFDAEFVTQMGEHEIKLEAKIKNLNK